jgi:hypothetical protein
MTNRLFFIFKIKIETDNIMTISLEKIIYIYIYIYKGQAREFGLASSDKWLYLFIC